MRHQTPTIYGAEKPFSRDIWYLWGVYRAGSRPLVPLTVAGCWRDDVALGFAASRRRHVPQVQQDAQRPMKRWLAHSPDDRMASDGTRFRDRIRAGIADQADRAEHVQLGRRQILKALLAL